MTNAILNEKEISSGIPLYTFNRAMIPFPENQKEKVKPPACDQEDTSELFKKTEILLSKEEKREELIREHMDAYRKAERTLVINFYTGGSAYKKGMLDAMYRGFNPLNP